jgi:hypothetical protein
MQGKSRETCDIVFTGIFCYCPSHILKSRMYYFCAPFHSCEFPQTHFLPSSSCPVHWPKKRDRKSGRRIKKSALRRVYSITFSPFPLFPHPFNNTIRNTYTLIQIVYSSHIWNRPLPAFHCRQMTASGQRQKHSLPLSGSGCAEAVSLCRQRTALPASIVQIKTTGRAEP